MKINKQLHRKLNNICHKYSGWMLPSEVVKIYDELDELGITVPAWSSYDENRGHEFMINGETVENSMFVLSTYKSIFGPKNEYTCYFSQEDTIMLVYKTRRYCQLGHYYHYDGLKKVSKLEGLVLCQLYGYKIYQV